MPMGRTAGRPQAAAAATVGITTHATWFSSRSGTGVYDRTSDVTRESPSQHATATWRAASDAARLSSTRPEAARHTSAPGARTASEAALCSAIHGPGRLLHESWPLPAMLAMLLLPLQGERTEWRNSASRRKAARRRGVPFGRLCRAQRLARQPPGGDRVTGDGSGTARNLVPGERQGGMAAVLGRAWSGPASACAWSRPECAPRGATCLGASRAKGIRSSPPAQTRQRAERTALARRRASRFVRPVAGRRWCADGLRASTRGGVTRPSQTLAGESDRRAAWRLQRPPLPLAKTDRPLAGHALSACLLGMDGVAIGEQSLDKAGTPRRPILTQSRSCRRLVSPRCHRHAPAFACRGEAAAPRALHWPRRRSCANGTNEWRVRLFRVSSVARPVVASHRLFLHHAFTHAHSAPTRREKMLGGGLLRPAPRPGRAERESVPARITPPPPCPAAGLAGRPPQPTHLLSAAAACAKCGSTAAPDWPSVGVPARSSTSCAAFDPS